MATHHPLFLPFLIRSHCHPHFPRQKNWSLCFSNGLSDPSDTHKGFACLPYISGLAEPLTRLLRKNDIRIANKPFKTLQQEFPSPKFRQLPDLQSNVVYKIPCKDCPWNYIGETGRCFQTQKKEHQRNLKNYTTGSNVANHAWQNNHSIDFDNACGIYKGNYRVRKTLESWHTAKTFDAENNSKAAFIMYPTGGGGGGGQRIFFSAARFFYIPPPPQGPYKFSEPPKQSAEKLIPPLPPPPSQEISK